MRAFLIDPARRSVEELDFRGNYKQIQRLLSYTEEPVLFTIIEVDYGDTLFLDDEGLLKKDLHAFHWKGYPNPLAGKGLLLGTTGDGNSGPTRMTLEDVQSRVVWTDLLTTSAFFNNGRTLELPNGTAAVMGPDPVWRVE